MSADHDMAAAHETQGCHQEDPERSDCGPRVDFSAECCEISDGTQEAEAATRIQATRNENRPALIGNLDVERPPELPVDATWVLKSQQHELGRFALLASFLL